MNPTQDYVDTMANYFSKKYKISIEEAKKIVVEYVKSYNIKHPIVTYNGKDKNGDMNVKKAKLLDYLKETKANTFTRKITNGANSINQFWGNRLNWWETSKNSTATPFVRGLHNFITRPIVAYEFVREGIPGGIELAKVLGGLDNTFDPRPLWGFPRLLPKIQSDSTTQDIQSNQPIQFNYSDTTQNRQMIDSVKQLNEKRSLYGLGHQNRE